MAREPQAVLQTTALLAVLSALPLYATDWPLRLSQIHKQYWQVEQGLPRSYVMALRHVRSGYLMVGTDGGLARFDGLTFRKPRTDADLRLSERWISALLEPSDGTLWVGTFDNQVFQLRDGKRAARFDVGGSVFDLAEAQGAVWASTRNGVFRIEGARMTKYPDLDAPLDTSWKVFSVDEAGELWVITSKGLLWVRQGSAVLRIPNGGSHGEILTVIAERGELFLGTSTGLFRLKKDPTAQPVRVAGVTGPVVVLLRNRQRTLWAGTWGHGICRINESGIDRWTSKDGLPDDYVRTLCRDREDDLWIGMRSGGLGRWRHTRLAPHGVPEGMAGDYATTAATDPAGELWLGTWRGGLYKQAGGRFVQQPIPSPTLYFTVRAMTFDRRGHLWAGNWEGIFEYDGKAYRHYAAEAEAPHRRVSVLKFDGAGGLWVGTADRGLFYFASGTPDVAGPPLLDGVEITALEQNSTGGLWIGTGHGLYAIADIHAPQPVQIPELRGESIGSVLVDSHQRTWATARNGDLLVITGARSIVLSRRHGLPGQPLYRLLEDAEGAYWVSSPRGLLEISAASLEEVLAGNRAKLDILVYDTNDGMRTVECHGLSQPAGVRSRDGSLWFPTTRGFVEVRRTEHSQLSPPASVIEELRTSAGFESSPGVVELASGARDLEIQFSALRLSSPSQVQIRYRMTGFDLDWISAGAGRSAKYNQLPPGSHRFEVRARDAASEWGPLAAIDIRQLPPFHQTWLFRGALALAAVALVIGAFRWRVHLIRVRYALVLEERNRIGREWHDTLVAGFSAISLQLEAVLAHLKQQPERAAEILNVTRQMVHHYRAEARRVIWDLRDGRPLGETLPEAVESAYQRVTGQHGIIGGVLVTGECVELPVEVHHNILRICQEAMSNAVRHGRCSRLDVELAFHGGTLAARVRDDGCGFSVSDSTVEAAGHFGLTVMRERARRIGGSLRVKSDPGEGTIIEAVVPISAGAAKDT